LPRPFSPSLLIGLAALLLVERALSEWWAWQGKGQGQPAPAHPSAPPAQISFAGLAAVSLLALSPSFVFWCRQGIFVTNLTQPLVFWSLWQAVRWLRIGRPAALLQAAFAAGLALYAKLIAVWIILPAALIALGAWLWLRRNGRGPRLAPGTFIAALALFLLPLLPLLAFNLQTGGTFSTVSANLGSSYYGVDNRALLTNLGTRLTQLVTVLRGDHFWYLGGLYANVFAPWLAALALIAGILLRPRAILPPLALLALAVLFSSVTISDLFITHYSLLHPLMIAVIALSLAAWSSAQTTAPRHSRLIQASAAAFLALWIVADLNASVAYHRVLTERGGLAGHSAASYQLAYYLRTHGMSAPIALDWGIEAPVRFLTQDAVQPIELFGYTTLDQPDTAFTERIAPFLGNRDNVYLVHAPAQTVFRGRHEAFAAAAQAAGLTLEREQVFPQQDGTPIFEIWRAR
jgi:hypothetical protein